MLPLDTLRDELDQFLKRGFGVDSALYTFAIGLKVQSNRSKLLNRQYNLAQSSSDNFLAGSMSNTNRDDISKRMTAKSSSRVAQLVNSSKVSLSRNNSDDALSQQGEETPTVDSERAPRKSPRSTGSTPTPQSNLTKASSQTSFTSISLPSSFFGFGRCANDVVGGNPSTGVTTSASNHWKWVMVSLTAVNVGLLATQVYMRLKDGRVVSKGRRG